MKIAKILATLFLVLVVCTASTMEKKVKNRNMYMVGVSASFTDSLIYFTDIMVVDSLEFDDNDYLQYRQQYSEQMEMYLEQKENLKHRTCFIYFHEKKNKLEKKIQKMKSKYQKEGKSILRDLGADFKFTKAVGY